MASKVGPKGQVVIPKAFREELGIEPGASVVFRLRREDGLLELRRAWADPIREGPRSIEALMRRNEKTRTAGEELLAMRREDESLWQEQFQRWSARHSSSMPTPSSSSSTGKRAPS